MYFALSLEQARHQGRALVRMAIGDERRRSDGGGRVPRDRERAPRERRVADERRFGDAVVVQIRCDEPIDRIGPLRPRERRQIRTLQCQRRLPQPLRRGGGRRLPRAFVDPAAKRIDLTGGQRREIERHARREIAIDAPDQDAAGGVAWFDRRPAAAAEQRIGVARQRQPARAPLRAVATETFRREDRVHLLLIVDDGCLRRGRLRHAPDRRRAPTRTCAGEPLLHLIGHLSRRP